MNIRPVSDLSLWLGFGIGLVASARLMHQVGVEPIIAQWALLSTLCLVVAALTMLVEWPHDLLLWQRLAVSATVCTWVLLLGGYPLWDLGEWYDIGWSLSAYTVMAAIAVGYYRQVRSGHVHRLIATHSLLLPTLVAVVFTAHLLRLIAAGHMVVGTLCLLLVGLVASLASALSVRRAAVES